MHSTTIKDVFNDFFNLALVCKCIEPRYGRNGILVLVLSKIDFKELLSLATKESYLIFNGKLYKRVDGVRVSSPLGPTLANDFLVYCK